MATAPDNPFDEIEIAAAAIRKLGRTVTIERRPCLDLGTDEIWTIMAHAGGGYGFGQGGTLRDAVADFKPRPPALQVVR